MKKIFLGSFVVLSLLITSFAFAAVTGYQSSKIPLQINKTLVLPPTAINILNYSQNTIYIVDPVLYEIPEGTGRSVTHPKFSGNTRITIQDFRHNNIFSEDVCNHGVIIVRGITGTVMCNP